MWNELLLFPLDACAAPSAFEPPALHVSVRHHSITVFQRDALIAETDIALPAPAALADAGARGALRPAADCRAAVLRWH